MDRNLSFISVSSTNREVANFVLDDDNNYILNKEVIFLSEIWEKVASIMAKIDKQKDGEFIVLKISSGVAIMVTLIKREKYNMRIPFLDLTDIKRIEVLWEKESKLLTFVTSNDGEWNTEYESEIKYDEYEMKKIFYQLILEEGFVKKQRVNISASKSSLNIVIN